MSGNNKAAIIGSVGAKGGRPPSGTGNKGPGNKNGHTLPLGVRVWGRTASASWAQGAVEDVQAIAGARPQVGVRPGAGAGNRAGISQDGSALRS